MKKVFLCAFVIAAVLTGCEVGQDEVYRKSVPMGVSESSEGVSPSKESTGVLKDSLVYSYVCSFGELDSAEMHGSITQTIGATKNTMDFDEYKDGNKQVSVIRSNGLIGWAEYTDGSVCYALNLDEKVYSDVDVLSLNHYAELLDLFNSADSVETAVGFERIHIYNEEYGIDTYLLCTLSQDGISIEVNSGKQGNSGKYITVRVGTLTDRGTDILDISKYEKEIEESSADDSNVSDVDGKKQGGDSSDNGV